MLSLIQSKKMIPTGSIQSGKTIPTVLMVAEKPVSAEQIAKTLSGGGIVLDRLSINEKTFVYEFYGKFFGKPAKFKVTSTCGHVTGLGFEQSYGNWEDTNPLDLLDATAATRRRDNDPTLKMEELLRKEAVGCQYLVLWLDCDPEGEKICFEVIDLVSRVFESGGAWRWDDKDGSGEWVDELGRQAVYRARFYAITDDEITEAMGRLERPDEKKALAVEAREEIDLRVGCAFTRLQTIYFRKAEMMFEDGIMSCGPCQTPTLGFCVARHDEIENFESEDYGELIVVLSGDESMGEIQVKPTWGGRVFDKDVGYFFKDRIQQCVDANQKAVVVSVDTKEVIKPKPVALRTIDLLIVAASRFNIGAKECMEFAEQLYTHGYISYPRTDTSTYPPNFDFMAILDKLRVHRGSLEAARALLKQLQDRAVAPRVGDSLGAHPPITPVNPNPTNKRSLKGDCDSQRRFAQLVNYICQHFMATISEDCKYEITTVIFRIGEDEFIISGKQVIDPGFTSILKWEAIEEDEFASALKSLQEGQSLSINGGKLKLMKRKTNPPNYLTEAELIALMDKHGIGTEGSIAEHISKICQREFVEVVPVKVVKENNTKYVERRLKPTLMGIQLIHGYNLIDPELTQPTMRAALEEQMQLIAKGQSLYVDVRNHFLDIYKRKFQYFSAAINRMAKLFEKALDGKVLARCDDCQEYMKLLALTPAQLRCEKCQLRYIVFEKPANKKLKMADGSPCGQCNRPNVVVKNKQKVEITGCVFCDKDVREAVRGPDSQFGGGGQTAIGYSTRLPVDYSTRLPIGYSQTPPSNADRRQIGGGRGYGCGGYGGDNHKAVGVVAIASEI